VTLDCEGLSNRRFAEWLVVGVKTVEFHLTNAFRRLDVSTRAELRHVVRRTGA
jgi:DNA-binding NarL/FixJ family response regulator